MKRSESPVTDTDAPVVRRLRDSVVDSILELVGELQLAPGDALPTERELSVRLEVSRNVIRQSFDILEERGLITSRRGSGRYLRTVDEESQVPMTAASPDVLEIASIADILETRLILEEQTVVMACHRRTSEELAHLVDLGRRLDSWQDNLNFHVAIAAATHNFMIERLVHQQIELSADLHQRSRYDEPNELAHMRSEHERIVQAIGSRDEDRARTLMREHLRGTRRSITTDLGNQS